MWDPLSGRDEDRPLLARARYDQPCNPQSPVHAVRSTVQVVGRCSAYEQVCAQIEVVDKKVAQTVQDDERVQRLTTVPSVGPVTAATFIALVGDIARFDSKAKLPSYLGLVPREYSFGEKQQRGHITKAGNSPGPLHRKPNRLPSRPRRPARWLT